MGIISLEQTDGLYWLGRYSERVYTTIRLYSRSYDRMLDENAGGYEEFCRDLDIPNIYQSSEDFKTRYPFDKEDPNSIMSNLLRAYDNAIVLRETIGSETLSYIQLAIYEMNKAEKSQAPLIEMQKVMDNILAFWGIADDIMEDENSRNIIKVGKRVERIDLYGRLHQPRENLVREVSRLAGRIGRCNIHYNESVILNLLELVQAPELDYYSIVYEIERIL
ncbi:MAG: alpha-E domain-containing protein [Firmicutes bacterium]|nr:alpha-E domain-containing protein [Lachnospiraceae bacterium]MDD6065032.1 alpha-E domain-containing protein [Bacillota bacterium]MDY2820566.1 alpha-E domain-containing protein [Hominisplanchenecus sp.]